MRAMTATDAKNRFGQLLETAQAEPVHIQKNGRDVGVLVSPGLYNELIARTSASSVRSEVERLLQESIEKRRPLYRALAK